NEYSYGVRTSAQGEGVVFSEVYTVPVGEEKIYDSQIITLPKDGGIQALDDENRVSLLLQKESEHIQSDELVFTFAGDCTLGALNYTPVTKGFHAYINAAESPTYPFDKVKALFNADKLTFINLEGTLTKERANNEKEYRFAGEPEWAKTMIKASGIELCDLANNHSYDYLKKGYEDTVAAVTDAGMHALDEKLPYISKINGVEVVILAGNYVHDAAKPQHAGLELTNWMEEQVKRYKKPDNIVIVAMHWGVELQTDPIPEQKSRAHTFIDAGADFVVGSHPHVIQGIENYKGKYIVYSLGNFAFGGNPSVKSNVLTTMMVRPRFALRDGKTVVTGMNVVPCYTTSDKKITVNNYQPKPIYGEQAQKAVDKILKLSKKLSNGVKSLECYSTEIN
ncbi:MAG: CapA family protein, partial [Oscillospiraceae bacterium]|nr:CapA family protein [Oscillospiraceae bacterium]